MVKAMEHKALRLEWRDAKELAEYPDLAAKVAYTPEPWELTRGEFAETRYGASTKGASTMNITIAELNRRKLAMRPESYALHRRAVEQALSEHKPVPVKVVMEYPGLAHAWRTYDELDRPVVSQLERRSVIQARVAANRAARLAGMGLKPKLVESDVGNSNKATNS